MHVLCNMLFLNRLLQIMIDINLKILIGGFEYRYCQNVFAWCFEISANYTGGGVNLISCTTLLCVLVLHVPKHMCTFWL